MGRGKQQRCYFIITAIHSKVLNVAILYLQTLLHNADLYEKGDDNWAVKEFLGNGLVTGSGLKVRHERKLLNPGFNRQLFDGFLDVFNKGNCILITSTWTTTDTNARRQHFILFGTWHYFYWSLELLVGVWYIINNLFFKNLENFWKFWTTSLKICNKHPTWTSILTFFGVLWRLFSVSHPSFNHCKMFLNLFSMFYINGSWK